MQRRNFLISGAAFLAACASPSKGGANRTAGGASPSAEVSGASLPRGEYRDFEFSADVRARGGAKGWICFHSDENLDRGYRVAINNDTHGPGWWRMTGSLLGVRNVVKDFARDGEWFSLKIRVDGALVEVFANGVKAVEYIEPEKPYRTPENSGMTLSRGRIGLKVESGEIDLKNASVRPLAPRADTANQRACAIDEGADDAIRLHQRDFPVLDYHVHLKGGLTPDWALARSRKLGINYAVAPNCGRDFQINRPEMAEDFLKEARSWPFLICMQAEGREWHRIFPESVRDKFDFVFTDAMTFDDAAGRRTHVWKPEEVICPKGSEEAYMEHIVNTVCSVVAEPSDVYANPLWLPGILAADYEKHWTAPRKQRVLEALVRAGKPMEINTTLPIPDMEFIEMAHARGVKFTFGTNNINPEFSPFGVEAVEPGFGKFGKVLDIVNRLSLSPSDLYAPRRRRA